jgi:hypothetical protein
MLFPSACSRTSKVLEVLALTYKPSTTLRGQEDVVVIGLDDSGKSDRSYLSDRLCSARRNLRTSSQDTRGSKVLGVFHPDVKPMHACWLDYLQ